MNSTNIPKLLITLTAICLIAVPAGAGPITENVPAANGQVNWSDGVLNVTGMGVRPKDADSPAQARLLARRAAIADAYRNMAHLISEVRVTANTTVERYLAANDTIRLYVEAYIRGAQVVEDKEDAEGVYTVALRVGMLGKTALSGIVLPQTMQAPAALPGIDFTPPVAPPTLASPTVALPGSLESDLLTPADASGPFTGLIIDARGFNVQPAMSPRVLDASGQEIYGSVRVDPEFAEDMGIVGYMGTIRAGMNIARVGKRPLVIRAAGTPDLFRRYVTLSATDAQRVLAENETARFLEKCAVVFVVDERRARDEGK